MLHSVVRSVQCKHVVEGESEFVFQRYCHVYRRGELENLCSSVPGCRIAESGWDRGNWFVRLVVDKAPLALLQAWPQPPSAPSAALLLSSCPEGSHASGSGISSGTDPGRVIALTSSAVTAVAGPELSLPAMYTRTAPGMTSYC